MKIGKSLLVATALSGVSIQISALELLGQVQLIEPVHLVSQVSMIWMSCVLACQSSFGWKGAGMKKRQLALSVSAFSLMTSPSLIRFLSALTTSIMSTDPV
jgi:hypothetical protein